MTRWLRRVSGHVVELTCHPGRADATLLGRDATPSNGQLQRRPDELHLLRQPEFTEACQAAGFTLIAPAQLRTVPLTRRSHAA